MGFKGAALGILLICLFAGSLSAIMGNVTAITSANQARWTGTSSSQSLTTQGGNITNANISSAIQLTTKWADFYGNISGSTIALRDSGGTNVYAWVYSAGTGKGEVCVSTGTSFLSGTLASANLTEMNSFWNLGTTDNSTNTFNTTFNGLNISGSVFSPAGARLQGSSSFTTAAIYNSINNGTKSNYAFCSNISNSGTNYLGTNYNYEMMVPTTPGATETYYFYIELVP